MKIGREDAIALVLVTLLSSTPIAFMSFDFMFPNISTPSLEKNLLAVFAISALAGMAPGYLLKRTDLAMMSVMTYTPVGYMLAVLLYSAPYTIYNLDLLLPGFYYTLFFRFTMVLLFLFVLGGFVGAVFGSLVRDSIRREETALTFGPKKD
jgi:hypothetical protein